MLDKSQAEKSKVTVVIPNYNGMKWVDGCMESLKKQNFKEFDIIVVDNASADGSAEYIEKEYPEALMIKNKKNYGFSRAVNIGIKRAKAEYVILLNNDTEADPDYVGKLYEAIDRDENIFSCSSKMINYNNKSVMDDAGDLYTAVGFSVRVGADEPIEKHCKRKEVFTACAGAAIYRKEVFDKIGFFDVRHFAYLEDIDVGYRARIEGYKNIYCPEAIVYHIGSASSGGTLYSDFKVKLSARNNIYLIYKNMPPVQIGINFIPLLMGTIVKLLFFKKKGFGKAYVEGLVEGFKTVGKCKRVPYKKENFWNYVKIQYELIANTFTYASMKLRNK